MYGRLVYVVITNVITLERLSQIVITNKLLNCIKSIPHLLFGGGFLLPL